jgi:hypothetical protein
MKPEPLTDGELDRLNSVLARSGDKHSMNLETLDGFLVSLICGPDTLGLSINLDAAALGQIATSRGNHQQV